MATIGLVGGSFNPAHYGHIEISKQAKTQLKLDEVWWIVTPQNPIKDRKSLAPAKERLEFAINLDKPDFIKVKLLEKNKESNYSIDLINKLLEENQNHKFIWLMGADNLAIFHSWRNWQQIVESVNIAIFPRNNDLAKQNILQENYSDYLLESDKASLLREKSPPYWCIIPMEKINISATEIRNGHNT